MPSVLPDESFSGHELELLHDVSASIQAFSDLNELLRHILRKIKTAFDIEGASIALHDPAQKEFVPDYLTLNLPWDETVRFL